MLIALAPVAMAEGPGGTGPEDALTASSDWQALSVGGEHWYAFQAPGADAEGAPALVTIELQAAPVGSVVFSVWDRQGLQQRAAAGPDETVEALGRGSAAPLDELGFVERLDWAGSLVLPGPYFVRVQQVGPTAGGYALRIGGAAQAVPGRAAVAAPAAAQPAPQAAAPAAARGGTGPDDAFTATGAWQALGVGEGHWYVFRTDGADADGNAPQVTVELQSTPPGSASFCVWTPEGLRVWATGAVDEFTLPVGRSTALERGENSTVERALWSGQPYVGGKYYVCVRQTGDQPTHYALTISAQ
jgi:hypothetical protein